MQQQGPAPLARTGPSPCEPGAWPGVGQAGFGAWLAVDVAADAGVERRVQMTCRGSPAMIAAAAIPMTGASAVERSKTVAITAPKYQPVSSHSVAATTRFVMPAAPRARTPLRAAAVASRFGHADRRR